MYTGPLCQARLILAYKQQVFRLYCLQVDIAVSDVLHTSHAPFTETIRPPSFNTELPVSTIERNASRTCHCNDFPASQKYDWATTGAINALDTTENIFLSNAPRCPKGHDFLEGSQASPVSPGTKNMSMKG